MDATMWMTLISTIFGVLGVIFGIFLAIRNNQHKVPQIAIKPGFQAFSIEIDDEKGPAANQKNSYKTEPFIETIVYGIKKNGPSRKVVFCPYTIYNNSKIPIKNVELKIEYSQRFFFDFDRELNQKVMGELDEQVIELSQNNAYKRECSQIEGRTQITINLDLIRPGQCDVIFDALNLSETHQQSGRDDLYEAGLGHLKKKMKGNEKFVDFSVIDYFVYSENCEPIRNKLKVFWVDSDSGEEIVQVMNQLLPSFFGGKLPKGGRYLSKYPRFFDRGFQRMEIAEIAIPSIMETKNLKNEKIQIQFKPVVDGGLISYYLPKWNYYEDTKGLSGEELVYSKTGYVKVK